MSRHEAFVRNMRIVADSLKRSNKYDQRCRMSYIPITNEKIRGTTSSNLAKMDEDLYMKILDNFSNDFTFKNNFNNNDSEYVDIGLFAEYHKYFHRCAYDVECYLSEVDNHTAVSFTTSLHETNRKQIEKNFSKLCLVHNFHAIVNRKFIDDSSNTLHISSICWKLDSNLLSVYSNSPPISRMFSRLHPSRTNRLFPDIGLA